MARKVEQGPALLSSTIVRSVCTGFCYSIGFIPYWGGVDTPISGPRNVKVLHISGLMT